MIRKLTSFGTVSVTVTVTLFLIATDASDGKRKPPIKIKTITANEMQNLKLDHKETQALYNKWTQQAIGSLLAAMASQITLPFPMFSKQLEGCFEKSETVVGYAQCFEKGHRTKKILSYLYGSHFDSSILPRIFKGAKESAKPDHKKTQAVEFTRNNEMLSQWSGRSASARQNAGTIQSGIVRPLTKDEIRQYFQYHRKSTTTEYLNITFDKNNSGNALGVHENQEVPYDSSTLRRQPVRITLSQRKHNRAKRSEKSSFWPGIPGKQAVKTPMGDILLKVVKTHMRLRQRLLKALNTVTQYQQSHKHQQQSITKPAFKFGSAQVASLLKHFMKTLKPASSHKPWKEKLETLREMMERKQKLDKLLGKMKRFALKSNDDPLRIDFNSRRPLAGGIRMDSLNLKLGKKKQGEFLANSTINMEGKGLREPPLIMTLFKGIHNAVNMLAGGALNENQPARILSPRFLSVLPSPDKNDNGILSPAVLSFHNEGISALPQLLTGLGPATQQAWMDLVMEVSGASEALDEAIKTLESEPNLAELNKEAFRSVLSNETITNVFGDSVLQVMKMWEELYATYTEEQLHDLNTKGYSFLKKPQLQKVYGPGGILNGTKLDFDINQIDSLSPAEKEATLLRSVTDIAASKGFEARLKDVVLTPSVLNTPFDLIGKPASKNPLILSPLVLSPIIMSPSVLGGLVLSPWVLVPVILSPSALSPLILSPVVGSPFILSPFILNPVILSPAVLTPFILSPFALSPDILSPEVLNPKILSPILLSPRIGAPGFGSPLILSPFALTPIILSPQDLFALVLSPSFMSPVIKSKLKRTKIVLSPSIFS